MRNRHCVTRTENAALLAIDGAKQVQGHAHTATTTAKLPDDRYPGSFFKVPSVPRPGTLWSVAK